MQAANIHGDSPLHIAARENRLDCVTWVEASWRDFLVNCGDKQDSVCKLVLKICLEVGGCWRLVNRILPRLFLTRGADVFRKNREGETPPDCCSHNTKAWAALQANRRERDAKNSRLNPEEKLLHRLRWCSLTLLGQWGFNVTDR